MSKASYPLKHPASVKAAAARLAKEDGVSLNQWISVEIVQKFGVAEMAADFLARRVGKARLRTCCRFSTSRSVRRRRLGMKPNSWRQCVLYSWMECNN